MRRGLKFAAIVCGSVLTIAVAAAAFHSVDERKIGRNDPKSAANYRLPWFNFSETYQDGSVLGVLIGSTKAAAIRAAERAGLTVSPSGWGDSRAGGADLYERSALLATMLRQPELHFHDPVDLKKGMIVRFKGDRVSSIQVYYINFEAI